MDVKTIKHIASLARIRLTEKEEEGMKGELSSILSYIEQLNRVDTDNIEPIYQTTGLINSMREDNQKSDFEMNNDLDKRLIGQAPASDKRFIKVKSVLNK